VINSNIHSTFILDKEQFTVSNTERDFGIIYERKSINDDESRDHFFDDKSIVKFIDDENENFKIYLGPENEPKIELLNKKLRSFSNTVYIPLNRKVKGLDNLETYKRNERLHNSNRKNIEDSLDQAQKYFAIYNNRITFTENRINANMRAQMINHFSKPIGNVKILSKERQDFSSIKNDLKDIVRKNVIDNIIELQEIYQNTLDSYSVTDGIINIIEPEKFVEHNFAFTQLKKLEEIANIAKKEKKRIDRLKMNLKQILDSINLLFQETGKVIAYETGENRLYFLNQGKRKDKLNLDLLSSGEKQIVVFFIFALIEYETKGSKLLLIDEPELSLHIEWQAKLLPLLITNDDKAQIIIATHSPDIIGDFYSNTSEVKGR
ncbi:AAA family ATPase, partial [Bacillus sp. JJ722]|uniref:AAA family ATPase n=1 Tax=Bacillus sp. JJ722 TaxID=3122973 RepID=UPI002FFD81D5